MTLQDLDDLNAHHGVPGARWVNGPAGTPVLDVVTEQCQARVSAWGAQVVAWTPLLQGDAAPVPALFCSPRTAWGGGRAIRGGIPVCFPWFGPRADDPQPQGRPSPSHGFARIRPWFVERVVVADNGRVEVTFLLVSDDDTLSLWPHAFEARLTASLGTSLGVTLAVTNVDDVAFDGEAALHTYVQVADVEAVALHGLEGTRFIDKVAGGAARYHGREPLRLRGEFDAVFVGTKQTVVVEDPGLSRSIRVEKTGSNATVVWSPGVLKATMLSDLGSDTWRSFVCVEAAQLRPQAIALSPGATHSLGTRITVTPMRRASPD
ncbi:MAG: D-hexose-6-phosphate mutarotase [Deltaproteobacteria bacterium]|nr:D-hexose-6-phosphate mutarotase [Deltaproteobacteria bacterium]